MDVHDDSRLEARQNFQEEIIDVSAYFHGVRTVDKEDVAGLKLREEFEVDVLYLLFDQGTQPGKTLSEKFRGNGSMQMRAELLFFASGFGLKPAKRNRCPLR